ncbi:TonB-dependent receptor plug domain-containing protein [Sphingomonas sp. CJ99]
MIARTTSVRALAIASLWALPATAWAEPVLADPASDEPIETTEPAAQDVADESIIVTGTRRTDRTVTQSAVPIDVFSAQTLETQASGDMNNLLRNLIPSFNVARFAIADGSTFVRPPTLRGLPPDQILVLVNGKRRHRAALVQIGGGSLAAGAQGADLAQIPTIAIERIEVLRDGAAAQYGSDAIAGVINYGLKRDAGLEVNSRIGQTFEGDGENYQLAVKYGLPLPEGNYATIAFEYLRSEQTSRGVQRPGAALLAASNPALYGNIRNPVQIWGDPQVEAFRGFINAGFTVTDDIEAYFFGNMGQSDQEGDFNYRQPVSITGPNALGTGTQNYALAGGIFNTLYTTPIPGLTDARGRPVYSAEGATFNFRSLYPLGFTPRFYGTVKDLSTVGGLRGNLGGLNFDFSASYGENSIDYYMTETLNPSMGPESPTDFYMGRLTQRETNFNADFTYPVDIGLASDLTIAFGAEHRNEAYQISLGDPASYAIGNYGLQTVQRADGTRFVNTAQQLGSNGFPGYGPDSTVNQGRNSYAFYGELEVDPLPGLSVSGAVRHENFDLFGTTTNWKATARYEFSPAIAVRGAASTGFRAPTPGQLFTTNVATAFQGPNPIESAIYPVSSLAAQAAGATPLSPEKSKNYSAGLVLTPLSSLSVTVDYYNIEVDDRIGLTGTILVDNEAKRQILRNANVANAESLGQLRYFTNAFATRTQGVDVVISYTMNTGLGRFATTLAGNYNETEVTRADTIDTGNAFGVLTLINRERRGDIENGIPKFRGNITETFTSGPVAVTGRASYFDSYTSFALPANGGDLKIGSEWTFDLEAAYQLTPWARVAIGAENIFNNYPDRNYRATGLANQNWYVATGGTISGSVYPDDSPIGINGGFYYARLNLDF